MKFGRTKTYPAVPRHAHPRTNTPSDSRHIQQHRSSDLASGFSVLASTLALGSSVLDLCGVAPETPAPRLCAFLQTDLWLFQSFSWHCREQYHTPRQPVQTPNAFGDPQLAQLAMTGKAVLERFSSQIFDHMTESTRCHLPGSPTPQAHPHLCKTRDGVTWILF